MKAVFQDKPGGKLYIKDVPVPVPGQGEVLVKMSFSPINPSDLSLLQGTFASRPEYPVIPGIEGSGIVVKSGGGLIPGLRKGKRVACTASDNRHGTWAEYAVTSATKTIPLSNSIDDEQGAMLLVNPLTAMAFIEMAERYPGKAVVNSAAASSLGKMLAGLCRKHNIKLINIITRESQYKILKDAGADNILISTSPSFEEELASLSVKLNAKIFFDAVGGDMTEIMIRNSPAGSIIVPYAKLSENNFNVDPRELIQKDKRIQGFYLAHHTSGKSLIENLRNVNRVKRLISAEHKIKVAARFNIEETEKAINHYRENMSAGKVLLFP